MSRSLFEKGAFEIFYKKLFACLQEVKNWLSVARCGLLMIKCLSQRYKLHLLGKQLQSQSSDIESS